MKARLTLVSASPRRQQLLERLKVPFDVAPSNVHERWIGNSPEGVAKDNAERKVLASEFFGKPGRVLLGADTIIHHNGQILGKPAGKESARRMLERLSGWRHDVITGFCLMSFSKSGRVERFYSDAVVSKVLFQELPRKKIRKYLLTDEWRGKAGAYAIQGEAGKFVLDISGDYDNVVGLPISRLQESIGTHFSDYKLL
ncbi:MAG: septum formation protein Maf [bacterium]|nr:septum formation protein Maf [bacterium]